MLQQSVAGNGYPATSMQYRHGASERPSSQYVNQRVPAVTQQLSKHVTFAGPESTSGTSSGASSGSGSCTDSATESEAEKRRTVYSITKYRYMVFEVVNEN